jgi:hypothetical protein
MQPLLTGSGPSAAATSRAYAVIRGSMAAGWYSPPGFLLAAHALSEEVQDDVPWRSHARIPVHARPRAALLGEAPPAWLPPVP